MRVEISVEEVLCLRWQDLFSEGPWEGFSTQRLESVQRLIEEASFFMPRDKVEEDPNYQQIIPYIIFRHQDHYLLNRRLGASGEHRLRNLYSLGIGGHINPIDGLGSTALSQGLRREWEEEVIYQGSFVARPIGLVKDRGAQVSQVHLGVVYLVEGDTPEIAIREYEKLSGELLTLEQMRPYYPEMESWSQLVYNRLLKGLD